MDNEKFKQFIEPHVAFAIRNLGGIDKVREMHATLPVTGFIAGWVCGSISAQGMALDIKNATWRDRSYHAAPTLMQEEIRRITDFVRLRIEADTTTA